MKLTLEADPDALLISRYTEHSISVGEQILEQSLILTRDRLIPDWGISRMAELTRERLGEVLELSPEIVVLGTGRKQIFPGSWVYGLVAEQGVGLEVMDTGAACRTYNILVAEGRRVAAALILGGK